MNDSFLEDLGLVSENSKPAKTYTVDRHVTTRNATSSPLQYLPEDNLDNCLPRNTERSTPKVSFALETRQISAKESTAKDSRKLSEPDVKRQESKVKMSERKEKILSNKLKPMENKSRSESKEPDIKDGTKSRPQETKIRRSMENTATVKIRSRRSDSCKENSHTDISSKENNRPVDTLKSSSSQADTCKDLGKKHECSTKKTDSREKDNTVLLNSIEELVSTYTKQESATILKAMQELYINGQANLIKCLMLQTDDLAKEIHHNLDSSRMKSLIEHNERLEEDVIMLQKQYYELKQENMALKLKCKELEKL